MIGDDGCTDRSRKKPILQVTEEGQKQLYSTRTKEDEVLLLNGVPEEQENVDDRQQVKLRDDRCCPTKRDQKRWWW